uniref:Nucleotide-sugar transporter n=1 Tax=Amorphochlora amoebiformis TaxID=1561963 RepID=A0A7S0D1P7_9EUKA|mmetsp:Transcript_16474/g.26093  ORF Transcript_16474/g.26093 Transcript_16474/m.26093 type:complete len:326 (+) Transcript_16474:34-1011(+)
MSSQFGFEAGFWSFLLAIQFGFQPDITRIFASGEVIATACVIVQEGLLKVYFGLQALLLTEGTQALRSWTLKDSLGKAGVPAALYAVQNLCTILAFREIDGLTYNILNQSKLIWNAVLVYIFLGESFKLPQILSLCVIIVTTLLITIDPEKHSQHSKDNGNYPMGVIYTLTASMISGIASTSIQYNLQKLKRNSYLMSAELGFYSAVFLMIKVMTEGVMGLGDGAKIFSSSFFAGFNATTLVPLATTSAGGIIVGQVTRTIGGVGKAYALLVGLLLSAIVHADKITWRLGISVPLIMIAFWLKFYVGRKPNPKSTIVGAVKGKTD